MWDTNLEDARAHTHIKSVRPALVYKKMNAGWGGREITEIRSTNCNGIHIVR